VPTLKAAKKALRQNKRKKDHNLAYKIKVRNLEKMAAKLISAKKKKEAEELLPQIYKALDKAAKIGIIKPNNASRRKSRLTIRLSKVTA
jgi:small subunit ribosomal protein S20